MPATIKVELRNAIEVQRNMERMVRELHGAPVLQAMRDATLLVQRDARKLAPVDRGPLRASITPEVRQHAATITGVVGSNLKYAAATEFGSKPHWAPFEAILGWVHRKGFAGTFSVQTRRRLGRLAQQLDEDRPLARAIWVHIARHGTKAHPFLVPAFEQNRGRIKELFERAVRGIVRR